MTRTAIAGSPAGELELPAPAREQAPLKVPAETPRHEQTAGRRLSRPVDVLRRPLVAVLVLGAIYCSLSLALAPSGEVADIGGKLATLRVMEERGTWTPDVGYWAAGADPAGDLHPLFYTERVGDSWAQVTTLPMLYAAYPLYRIGGDRAVVLLPILGALGCALAARALARRLGAAHGWVAFWAIGLATPVAVYALSFWEHTVGLALMLWAVVLLRDVARRNAGTRAALVAGVLFGAAATMRTEALVYAAVSLAVVCLATAAGRRWRAACSTGIAASAGLAAVLFANQLLERQAFGAASRSARAAGTARHALGSLSERLDLATTTATGISGFTVSIDWVVGAVACGLAVTALGVAFVVERSQSIADGTREIRSSAPGAIVSLDPHFFRESGASFDPQAHWLTAESRSELRRAAGILAAAGDRDFTVVAPRGVDLPEVLGAFGIGNGRRMVGTRPGEPVQVVGYHLT